MSPTLEGSVSGGFGRPLRQLVSTDSTNSEALRWIEQGAPHGATVVADDQTAGRGRWGRAWISAPGSSLLMSVVLRPEWARQGLGLLPIAAGLACAEALEPLSGTPARLKWPNDVLMRARKVAGVLIETRVVGDSVPAVVVGIGVDIDWPGGSPPESIATTATSLTAEARLAGLSGPTRADAFGAVLVALEETTSMIGDAAGVAALLERASARMDDLGDLVVLSYPDGSKRQVTAERLLPSGALLVSSGSGTEEVTAGAIESLRRLS